MPAQKTQETEAVSLGASLGIVHASPAAMGLKYLQQTQKYLAEQQKNQTEMQKSQYEIMSQVTINLAESTKRSLNDEAEAMRRNGAGQVAGGALSIGMNAGGAAMGHFSTRTQVNAANARMDVLTANSEKLARITPVPDANLRQPAAAVQGQAGGAMIPIPNRYPGQIRQAIRENTLLEDRHLNHGSISETRMGQYRDDTAAARKTTFDDRSHTLNIRDQWVNAGTGIGNSMNGMAGGAGSVHGSEAKDAQAREDSAKAAQQAAQQMVNGSIDRTNQVFNSLDSAKQALAQIHAEISAANRA